MAYGQASARRLSSRSVCKRYTIATTLHGLVEASWLVYLGRADEILASCNLIKPITIGNRRLQHYQKTAQALNESERERRSWMLLLVPSRLTADCRIEAANGISAQASLDNASAALVQGRAFCKRQGNTGLFAYLGKSDTRPLSGGAYTVPTSFRLRRYTDNCP